MSLHNMTLLENADTISDIVFFANEVSRSVLGTGFIVVLWMTILLLLIKEGVIKANIASSFVCFLISLFMSLYGIIRPTVVLYFVLSFAGSVILEIFNR